MKKLAVLLAAVLFLVQAGMVYAADVNVPAAGAHKTAKKASKKKATIKTVTGQVTAVDAAANTLSVKGRKGEVQLSTTAKTKGLALNKLKTGEKVTVRYRVVEGKNEAVSIKAPKAAKKRARKAAAAAPTSAPKAAPAPAAPVTKKPAMTGC